MKKLKVFAITRNDDGANCDTKKETVSDAKKEEMEAGDKSEDKRVGGG